MRKYPNLSEEKKLWKKGYKYVVGLDEAGRGPLAGPVVAAAVMIINPKFEIRNPKQIPMFQIRNPKQKFGTLENWNFEFVSNFVLRASNLKLRDSKRLSPRVREKFYKLLTTHPGIEWGIGKVSEKVIDKINILEATKLAMKKAINNLEKKLREKLYYVFRDRRKCSIVDFLILDGNFKLDLPTCGERNRTIPQKSIIKGDEKVFSSCLASIIAKVTRDRIMEKYDKKYPQYGFAKHKGYPTKYHLKMLKKYGPSVIHRLTFKPVKDIINRGLLPRKKFLI